MLVVVLYNSNNADHCISNQLNNYFSFKELSNQKQVISYQSLAVYLERQHNVIS